MDNNRKLAAIVFSDIVDCTKTMSKDEKLGFEYIKKHSKLVKENVSNYNGELLKELGDGCLLIFNSAYDALKFSDNLQNIINNNEQFKVRIGIHVGDIIKDSDDYFGSGVNIASRIYNFASPGEICITQDVYSQIKSHKDIDTLHMGNKNIKGIDDKVDVYKVKSKYNTDKIENKKQYTVSLLDEVINRRVLQFFGVYAAVGWTIIQFVDWITKRYQYSPHLVDLALAIVISMIPSILILSYFHGAPGKDKWTKVEKVAIPINLLASILILIIIFYPKDLGAITKTVTYEHMCSSSCKAGCDKYGSVEERVIPKVEFRKNILIFNFTIDDNIEDWMSVGIPGSLTYELLQDIYVNGSSQLEIESILGEYNKSMTDIIPFSLQREIAKKQNKQFFLNGSIDFNDDVFTIKTKLYNTKSSKIASEQSFESEDIYELIDKLSFSIRIDLGIPEKHLNENIDLPAIELLPNTIESMKYYTQGMIKHGDGVGKAIPYYEKAVEIDESCAFCYFMLQDSYVMNNQGDKRLSAIEKVLEYDYKLPERFKFIPKIMFYWETQQPEKMIKVAELQIQLYPENIFGYSVLAELYRNQREFLKQIEQYEEILKQFEDNLKDNKDIAENLLKIADIYLYQVGDYVATKKAVDRYLYYYPESTWAYQLLGKMYSYQGMQSKTIEMYETALTFDLSNVDIMIDLEWIRDGGVNRIKNIENILNKTTSMHDSATVYLAMSRLNREYGMLTESIKYNDKALKLKESYQQFMHYVHIYYWNATNYAKIGQYDKGYKIIVDVGKILQKPFAEFAPVRHIGYYIQSENWVKLNEIIPEMKEISLSYGVTFEDILFAEGYVYEYLHEDYLKAIEFYNQYLDTKANRYADIHISIARCYRLDKDFESALKKLDEISNSDLLYKWDANYQYALLYQDKGNIRKAMNYIDLMLEHYKHADPTLKKVNKAKALREELNKQL